MTKIFFGWKAAAVLPAAVLLISGVQAFAMNKAELVDAIANNAKLTKADAGRALDATLGAMTDILANEARKKGDKISLVGFGSFSVSERIPSDSDTCTPVADVEFEPANAFVKLINPIAMDKGLRFRVQSVGDGADGPVITGELQEGTVRVGDSLLLNNNPSSVGVITGGVIAGIVVAGVLVNEADAGPEISLLLRGIEKKDIRRGMVIVKPGTHREPGPPLSPCFAYFLDEQVAAIAAQSAGLRVDVVLTALHAAKETIMDTVAGGEAVDIEGFGVFYVLGERVLSVTDPGTDLPTGQARKVVKFKAGAELAGSVNKGK